jgi:leucyl-tRNA synthetase
MEDVDPETMTEAYPHEGVMVRSGPFDGVPSPDSIQRVVAWLEAEDKGRAATSYRLRDWLISRQRYWGAPIPIIHCPNCGEVAVPESDLPVELPDDVDFAPGGESPLARHEGFVNVDCPSCGGPARRDTDTMDTFVDSSWYFYRYCSPGRQDVAFDPADVGRWMPVDQYTGGINHAVLHLLYARFFNKVLFDLGMVGFHEPFLALLNQGMVIMQGSAMSKSRGNLVVFSEQLDHFGADVLRVTMLFAGPADLDVDWANVSPFGTQRWLGKVWRTVGDAASAQGGPAGVADGARDGESLARVLHRTVKGVTEDFDRHHFNTAISKLMVLTTELAHAVERGEGHEEVRSAAEALVLMLAPMAPHLAEELWRNVLGHEASVHAAAWPSFDEELAQQERVTMVVTVDGKVRDRIEVPADIDEETARRLAMGSERAGRFVDGRQVANVVVRPPKLVNIVTQA